MRSRSYRGRLLGCLELGESHYRREKGKLDTENEQDTSSIKSGSCAAGMDRRAGRVAALLNNKRVLEKK